MTKRELEEACLYQDEDLLVFNKPAGLLSIADRIQTELPNLKKLAQAAFGKLWVVHRLDRDTSGILLFARNEAAHRALSMQFEHGEVDKYYMAIAEGVVPDDAGEITLSIAEHPSKPSRMRIMAKGLACRTGYTVEERFLHHTLLKVRLYTGRTHQIRVHFQAIGHPLLADGWYGRGEAFFLSSVKTKRFNTAKHEDERPLLSRVALHAYELQFRHPVTALHLTLQAPLPKDLTATLQQLRKWDTR